MSEQRPPDDGTSPDDVTQHGAAPQDGASGYGAPQHGAGPQFGAPPEYGGAPPLGGPQYGAPPQYGGAPQYGAPQYGAPQYGAPQYGAPQYGAPYGYGPPQYEHPQGTTVLILGILGIVACQLASPFAWVMGNRALAEIDANPGVYSNRGLVVAGRICGIVGCVLLGLSLAAAVLYVIFVAAVIGSGA